NCFINYTQSNDLVFADIHEDKKGTIWLGTSNGLWFVDQEKLAIQKFRADFLPKNLQFSITKMAETANGDFCLATTNGIKILNPETNYYQEIKYEPEKKFSIGSNDVYSIAIDGSGYLWAACAYGNPLLHKIDLKN